MQAPTIYRLFGDKQGLLDAVAERGFAGYLAELSAERATSTDTDPVEDLRRGWDLHVDFGLRHPHLYSLAYGGVQPGRPTPAALAAAAMLAGTVHRVAAEGRLAVSEERAVEVIHAAGCGTTLTLITVAPEHRDLTLSSTVRDTAIATIVTDTPRRAAASDGAVVAAVQLRANLDASPVLEPAERGLLDHWLGRIADGR